ncbi:MAG TPA: hypothetical protein VM870_06845, partial [Pyrinomonadaceae bacterium]|nr:hypothetical protein [Pyrinomonadaceae bacterium]
MLKELIVSVNGREKKIAIIENGKVTEFYIERGESEQGIVGNIYKGRVMRVLPGMQSAFVDIGLERDAFLYVSDFFDDEEEFERIVIDKAKEGAPAAAAGIVVAPERDSAARRPREVTGADGEEAPPAGVQTDARAAASQPSSRREGRDGRDGRDNRSDRRGRRDEPRGGRQQPQQQEPRTASPSPQSVAEPDDSVFVIIPPTPEEEAIETPFAGSAYESSFERISDDDERAAEDGSMLKDAIMQERILDRIHAVEFDLDQADAPIDLSSTFANVSSASFQRIDDGGEEGETPVPETDRVQEAVAAHIKSFLDEANEQSLGRDQTAPLFERISDDEAAAGESMAVGASPSETAAVEKPARRSARGKAGGTTSNATTATRRSRRSQKADDAEPVAEAPTVTEGEAVAADEASAPKRGRGGSRAKSEAGRTAKGATSRRASTGGNKRAAKTDAPANGEGELPDAEASVGSSPARGEFATRRGGRRRRRGGSNNGGKQANEAAADDRPPQTGEGSDGES